MTEISNIDAIIDLIMREARSREEKYPVSRISTVMCEVNTRVDQLIDNLTKLDNKEEKEGRQRAWSKGM